MLQGFEVCERLGLSEAGLRHLIKMGELKPVAPKVGKALLFKERDVKTLDEWRAHMRGECGCKKS